MHLLRASQYKKLGIADIGGSTVIHEFGAVFGLAASYMITTSKMRGHSQQASTPTTDLFSMIGTVFLWLFWPSFNSALAAPLIRPRVIINTYFSLAACAVTAFIFSTRLRPNYKFDMIDIQNATLAGGVAVGCIADMMINPWGAILIGTVAGALSVYGFTRIMPYLERSIDLHDTCGVLNLHCMPGLLGGVAAAVAAAVATQADYGTELYVIFPQRAPANATDPIFTQLSDASYDVPLGSGRSALEQGGFQMAAVFVTFLLAASSGALAGKLAKLPLFDPPVTYFEDHEYWHVADADDGQGRREQDGMNELRRLASISSVASTSEV